MIYALPSTLQREPIQSPEIKRIILGGDSLLFDQKRMTSGDADYQGLFENFLIFPPSYNSIFFEFNNPQNEVGRSYFQYFLSGFDNEWSDWTSYSIKEYTNLNAGHYEFKARYRILMVRDRMNFHCGSEFCLPFTGHPMPIPRMLFFW